MTCLKTFLLTLFLLAVSVSSMLANDKSKSLELLDLEVSRAKTYIEKKEAEISRLRGNLQVATNVTDQYLSTKQLAVAYSKFNSDSALIYLRKCQELGRAMNNKEWFQDACIAEAHVYGDRGDDFSAMSVLKNLGTIEDISPNLKRDYAEASLFRFLKYSIKSKNDSAVWQQANETWNELSSYLRKDGPTYCLFYTFFVPQYDAKKLEKVVRGILSRSTSYSKESAMAYLDLYNALNKQGRKDEAFDALVQSAVADIRCANRSSSSLVSVIQILRDESCPYRNLSNYAKLCMDNVTNYRDVGRSIKLLEVQEQLEQLLEESYKKQMTALAVCLFVMLVIIVGGVAAFVFLRRKARSKEAIYLAQQKQMGELRDEIKTARQTLQQSDEAFKKQHSKDLYSDSMLVKSLTLWSSMLKDSTAFKKEVSNLLQTGMQRKVQDVVKKAVSHDTSFSQLFAWFDEIYLSLHHDFVERLNSVLNENARFVAEEKNRLSPEFRIFALISLGVTDTATIADILHYSSQTVYNYRSKMGHNTKEPEFDLNKFVQEMYQEG